jgi:hypothetical protein
MFEVSNVLFLEELTASLYMYKSMETVYYRCDCIPIHFTDLFKSRHLLQTKHYINSRSSYHDTKGQVNGTFIHNNMLFVQIEHAENFDYVVRRTKWFEKPRNIQVEPFEWCYTYSPEVIDGNFGFDDEHEIGQLGLRWDAPELAVSYHLEWGEPFPYERHSINYWR